MCAPWLIDTAGLELAASQICFSWLPSHVSIGAVRSITPVLGKKLKERLKAERDEILEGDIGYKHVVLPDTCIHDLCARAKFIC